MRIKRGGGGVPARGAPGGVCVNGVWHTGGDGTSARRAEAAPLTAIVPDTDDDGVQIESPKDRCLEMERAEMRAA